MKKHLAKLELLIEEDKRLANEGIKDTFYLSPEQIDTGLCTRQTDLWALGCLLY